MIVWIAFLAIPLILLAIFIGGLATQRGKASQLAHRCAIGLLAYGFAAFMFAFTANWFHTYPDWSGPESYGILVPFLVGFGSMVVGGVVGLIRLVLNAKIGAHSE